MQVYLNRKRAGESLRLPEDFSMFFCRCMSQPSKELYEFSRFRLDVSEQLLWCDGNRVSLPDKAFVTLIVLPDKIPLL